MTVTLSNGSKIDLPTAESVDQTIKTYESDLRKLRRLRDLVGEFNGESQSQKPTANALLGKE